MRRQAVAAVTAAFAVSAVIGGVSASAKTAPKKPPKPKVMKGSYQLTLPPDPTMEGTGQVGMECKNIDPLSADNHPLTLPGKGTLHIVLDSPDPTNGNLDWDLHLLNAAGDILASSNSPAAHEDIYYPGIGKGKVQIRACNLAGEPTATVTYTFTYR